MDDDAHSPILMAYPEAYIYNFSADGIERLDYCETEQYQVMHDFLLDPAGCWPPCSRPLRRIREANPAATIWF